MAESDASKGDLAPPPADAPAAVGPEASHGGSSEGIIALLMQIEHEAVSDAGRSALPVEIEFGIESLQDILADAGGETDALAAFGDNGPGECHPSASVGENSLGSADNAAGPFGAAAHLTVRIVFGDDESGSTPPL